jgi:CRISPR-associated protein, csd1 family
MTAYTQALNYLLRSDNVRRIGDITVVYWVENADPAIAAFAGAMLFGPQEQSDWSENDILGAIQKLVSGRTADLQDMHLSPDTHFYILGLAPNAARLSVRFFWQNTFTKLAKNVNAHYERLEITRPAYEKFDTLWPYTLARSAVRFSKDWKKADEELQKSFPRLSGDLLTSILNDTRYPATLLNGTVQRIRAEHDVTWARASVIKAYYSKNEDPLCPKEVLTVSVNKESTNIPYNLGRLFAVLERTQEAANPNINTTIKDRFFNSASATPSLVFPTLINLAQKHLAKLNEGQRIALDKSIGELSDKLGETFPKQLMLAEQGAFQLGYYQQRQEYFKKKTDTTEQKEEA